MSQHPIILYTDSNLYSFVYTKEQTKPQRIQISAHSDEMSKPHIIWMDWRNFSLSDLLGCSPGTTTQDGYRLKTVEIPDSIKFLMTHNQQSAQTCHYVVSKDYVYTVTAKSNVEETHFVINLEIKDKFFERRTKK